VTPTLRRLSAVVFAFAVIGGFGCSRPAQPTTAATADAEATAKPAPASTAKEDGPAQAKPADRPVAKEWYAPREADFRPGYDRDRANQMKESWSEYWSWVQTFYTGNFLSSGWTAQGAATLQSVRSEKARDELRADFNELGRRVAAEWAKDNAVRKIDTASLRVLGGRITKAAERDDGSGQSIQKELEAIQAEVNDKLAAK
jgi:hypothetical protein